MMIMAAGLWNLVALFQMLKKIGTDDPRRIVHAIKVGLALTLVSLFYYINPVFDGLGQPVIWAVLTVVLVMEFTVGAAISKGLNRTVATLLAGALGVGVHRLAALFGGGGGGGGKGELVVLGAAVFVVSALATLVRFVPKVKARYDYGLLIFILTFCMVAVSSYREESILMIAKDRLCTIAIGVFVSFFISILVFPVWAGEDLHRLAATNMEKLAKTMQSVGEALQEAAGPAGINKTTTTSSSSPSSFLINVAHKGVLHSKPTEDSLANLVRWEPPHRGFWFRHPWDQYLKLGQESRRCANLMEALNTHIRHHAPASNKVVEFDSRRLWRACTEMSLESGKALQHVASAVRSARAPPAATKRCMDTAGTASEQMKASLPESCKDLKQMLYVAPIVSILIEILGCTREIVAGVEELARRAHFKSSEEEEDSMAVAAKPSAPADAHVTIVVDQ